MIKIKTARGQGQFVGRISPLSPDGPSAAAIITGPGLRLSTGLVWSGLVWAGWAGLGWAVVAMFIVFMNLVINVSGVWAVLLQTLG